MISSEFVFIILSTLKRIKSPFYEIRISGRLASASWKKKIKRPESRALRVKWTDYRTKLRRIGIDWAIIKINKVNPIHNPKMVITYFRVLLLLNILA